MKKVLAFLFCFLAVGQLAHSQVDIEQELAFLQEVFGECMDGVEADDFDSIDELYMYAEENCMEGPVDPGDPIDPWEPSVEEEFEWMSQEFGECLADYTAADFATVEDLWIFVETTCFDEPVDPWEPSVEEEFEWMSQAFGECLDGYSAADFATIDDLYNFIEETCELGEEGGDTSDETPGTIIILDGNGIDLPKFTDLVQNPGIAKFESNWATNGRAQEATTGFNSLLDNAVNVQVYPNPATEYINISGEADISRISIINSVGQVLHTQIADNSNTRIELNEFENGMYIILIETSKGQGFQRLVLSK